MCKDKGMFEQSTENINSLWNVFFFNPFTAEVAIMRLLLSAEVAIVRPEKEEQSDWLV
jgi:hypothetical protein